LEASGVTGPMLNQREVCTLLRICAKQLQNLRRSRKIRFVRISAHCIRFRQEDVAEFLQRREEGFRRA
jgi:predicted site-specific integrase-resolvase